MNYIVSGLERSGTSLMMQMLEAGGVPIYYDKERSPDENNPKGYYELFGGKIISRLEKREVDLDKYNNGFVKVTTYGLKYLPRSLNKIIYMRRDLEEIKISSKKMGSNNLSCRELMRMEKRILEGLNLEVTEFHVFNYKDIINNPILQLHRMFLLLDRMGFKFNGIKALKVIDPDLYRSKI